MATAEAYNRNDGDCMEITEWKNGEDYTVSIDAGDRNVLSDITPEEPDLIY